MPAAAKDSKISFEDMGKFPRRAEVGRTGMPGLLCWSPDDTAVTFLRAAGDTGSMTRQLHAMTLADGTVSELVKPPDGSREEATLTLEEKLRRERTRQLHTGITSYSWAARGDRMLVPIGNNELWLKDGMTGKMRRLFDPADTLPGGGTDPVLDACLSSDGGTVGFVYDSEVYICATTTGSVPLQATHGARGTAVTHGLADFIAQEEMDRYDGFWLSGDGAKLAFEAVDESHIEQYRIMHQGADGVGAGSGAQEDHRYPFAGAPNPKVRLGVVDAPSAAAGAALQPVLWLDVDAVFGTADCYLARVAWLSGGDLLAQVQNREQTKLAVVQFAVGTGGADYKGAPQTLWTEEGLGEKAWINLHDAFHELTATAGGARFLWASERSGYCHLELRSADGSLLRALTAGEWVVDNVVGIDEAGGWCYFQGATPDVGPLECHLYRVPLGEGSGEPERLTSGSGMHDCVLNHTATSYIDTHSSLDTPGSVVVRATGAAAGADPLCVLHGADAGAELVAMALQSPELFTVPCPDDATITLHGCFYAPAAAVHGPGPYPTLVSVYGGPCLQTVTNTWAVTADLRAQHLRSRGYLVIKLDNRGSPRRGLVFEAPIKHDMGNLELLDQMAGVRWAVGRGLADATRVGMYGWSYGGYMSAMALARHPDVFKVAVAGAPVTHWDGYDTHYTERYMGTPASNPGGYKISSVMEHVAGIRGSLLLVHGLIDENVHFRHTARLINALIKAQKHHELMLFPNERHQPRGLADRIFCEQRVFNFIERCL
jgi:dipeptidyl-peptidase-4